MIDNAHQRAPPGAGDVAPGDEYELDVASGVGGYLIGFALAAALTVLSFYLVRTSLVWQPSIPIALSVLAIAQMGVHLVFFLHITSGRDNINNVMALAFGLLIVMLLVFGSLWIMRTLDHNAMPAAATATTSSATPDATQSPTARP